MRGVGLLLALFMLSCAGARRPAPPKPEGAPVVASASTPIVAAPQVAARNDFEMALIDDTERLTALEHVLEVPAGVSLVEELFYTGEGEMRRPRFVRLVLQEGEILEQALHRIASWLASARLPAERRLMWGPLLEADANDQQQLVGYRSYVLFPPSIVASDVAEAFVAEEPDYVGVAVQFSPKAAVALETLSREHRKERLAIVIRGLVQSAPVIQAEITGGRALVTPGGGTVEAMRASAEELVGVLQSQAK
jgi:hypothetical protein